jgi:undecaprenyl-diphosphatase
VYFFKTIIGYLKDRDMIAKVLLACLVTGLIGLFGKHFFESLFENPMVASGCLVVNGLLLIAANHVIGKGTHRVGLGDAFWMGLAQATAILPGISRSGTTISALAFCGVKKEEAFAFSFVSSLPLIAAAFALECKDAFEAHTFAITPAQWVGVGVAFVVGLCAIKVLSFVIKKTRFDLFGYYCVAMGVFSYAMQVSAK